MYLSYNILKMFLQLIVCLSKCWSRKWLHLSEKGKTEVIEAPSAIKYYTYTYVFNHYVIT